MNDELDTLIERSRWQREAIAATVAKIQSTHQGEAFRADPPAWGRFVGIEAARLVVVALFVAIIGAWVAIDAALDPRTDRPVPRQG